MSTVYKDLSIFIIPSLKQRPKHIILMIQLGIYGSTNVLVPSTITDYLALALAQAKSKLSEYL